MKSPDPNSKRTLRRKSRGFQGLLLSSRKHKRAHRRLLEKGWFNNKQHPPGEKGECASGPDPRYPWLYTAGGALKYH